MRHLLILLTLLLLTRSTQAYPTICDRIDVLAEALGAHLEPWLGYPQGWELPDDLRYVSETVFQDGNGGGVIVQVSPSTGKRYVWYFDDYIADGEPYGMHHFCGPYWLAWIP